jgi:hypothetical protein
LTTNCCQILIDIRCCNQVVRLLTAMPKAMAVQRFGRTRQYSSKVLWVELYNLRPSRNSISAFPATKTPAPPCAPSAGLNSREIVNAECPDF